MIKFVIFCLTLSPFCVFAEGGSLGLKETLYSYNWSDPSCRMQVLMAKEREKKLREYYFARGMDRMNDRLLASAIFISSYTNYSIEGSPLVSVFNHWSVTDKFIEIYENKPEALILEFNGNSLWWRERLKRFPEDVLFFLDKEHKELITVHQVFYSDYCEQEVATHLSWTTYEDPDNPTVEELLEILVGGAL